MARFVACGYLYKKSRYLGIFRQRWVVLSNGELKTYETRRIQQNGGDPTEIFDLTVYDTIESAQTSFILSSTAQNIQKRIFKSDSATTISCWVPKIKGVQTQLHPQNVIENESKIVTNEANTDKTIPNQPEHILHSDDGSVERQSSISSDHIHESKNTQQTTQHREMKTKPNKQHADDINIDPAVYESYYWEIPLSHRRTHSEITLLCFGYLRGIILLHNIPKETFDTLIQYVDEERRCKLKESETILLCNGFIRNNIQIPFNSVPDPILSTVCIYFNDKDTDLNIFSLHSLYWIARLSYDTIFNRIIMRLRLVSLSPNISTIIGDLQLTLFETDKTMSQKISFNKYSLSKDIDCRSILQMNDLQKYNQLSFKLDINILNDTDSDIQRKYRLSLYPSKIPPAIQSCTFYHEQCGSNGPLFKVGVFTFYFKFIISEKKYELGLVSLPPNISTFFIHYRLSFVELNETREEFASFTMKETSSKYDAIDCHTLDDINMRILQDITVQIAITILDIYDTKGVNIANDFHYKNIMFAKIITPELFTWNVFQTSPKTLLLCHGFIRRSTALQMSDNIKQLCRKYFDSDHKLNSISRGSNHDPYAALLSPIFILQSMKCVLRLTKDNDDDIDCNLVLVSLSPKIQKIHVYCKIIVPETETSEWQIADYSENKMSVRMTTIKQEEIQYLNACSLQISVIVLALFGKNNDVIHANDVPASSLIVTDVYDLTLSDFDKEEQIHYFRMHDCCFSFQADENGFHIKPEIEALFKSDIDTMFILYQVVIKEFNAIYSRFHMLQKSTGNRFRTMLNKCLRIASIDEDDSADFKATSFVLPHGLINLSDWFPTHKATFSWPSYCSWTDLSSLSFTASVTFIDVYDNEGTSIMKRFDDKESAKQMPSKLFIWKIPLMTTYKIELLLTAYLKSAENLAYVPHSIIYLCALFIDVTDIDPVKHSQKGRSFCSHVFSLFGLRIHLEVFPRGLPDIFCTDNTDFVCFVRIGGYPTNISSISYHGEFTIDEIKHSSGCFSDTSDANDRAICEIVELNHLKHEILNLDTLTVNLKMTLFSIRDNDDNILTADEYQQHIKIRECKKQKSQSCVWIINDESVPSIQQIKDAKCELFGIVVCHSDVFHLFGFKWCFDLTFLDEDDEINEMILIRIVSLSPQIARIWLKYELICVETNTRLHCFTIDKVDDDPYLYTIPNALCRSMLQNMDKITLKANIELLEVFDDEGIQITHEFAEKDAVEYIAHPTGSYQWEIEDSLQLLKMQDPQICSPIFTVLSFKWMIELRVEQNKAIHYLLHLVSFPPGLKRICMQYIVTLKECDESHYEFMQLELNQMSTNGEFMDYECIKVLETLTFDLKIIIFDVFDVNGNIVSAFGKTSAVSRSVLVPTETYIWQIARYNMDNMDDELIIDCKVGQDEYCSPVFVIFGVHWCLRMCFNEKKNVNEEEEKRNIKLYLKAVLLPPEITHISVSCGIKLDVTDRECLFCTQINRDKLFECCPINLSQLGNERSTFHNLYVEIGLIDVYNMYCVS